MSLLLIGILVMMPGGINIAAETDTETIYEETFDDGIGVATQAGNAELIVEDKQFPGNDNEKAVYVSNRSEDYDGVDIQFSDVGMEDGKAYNITVTGYIDDDVDVPEDAQALMQNIDSYEGFYVDADYAAGETFTLSGTYTVDANEDHAIRIQSNDDGKEIPFYIGEILITSEETEDPDNGNDDQVEIPEGEEVAAFTDFEDGTTQGWEPRGENEELTVVEGIAKNGDHSLLVENRKASSDAAKIDLFDEMYPGHEYEISLWVKLAEGEEDTPLQLSVAETVNGETSYYPPVIEPVTVIADEWVLLEGTYNVPDAIEALHFYVEEEYEEEQTTGVSYYIDDFKAEAFIPDYSVEDITPLKDIYEDHFYIGNAVEPVHFNGRTLELLTKHHNLVTAENIMKPENYYSDGAFDTTGPDRFLRNAVENDLDIHGHVLLWHSQSEDSLYQNPDGTYKSSEEALANMHEHIENVMQSAHDIAGDSIVSWDVVNEALDGDWSNPEDWESILRPASGWLQAIGPDYMYEAFLKARQVADDLGQYDMVLYYNDYNDHVQAKAETMYRMVKDINERYANEYPDDDRKLISGVGMQGHYTTSVNIENIRTSLERFISLGVEVGVTELDVGASEGNALTEEEELQQAYFYAQLFSLYKEHSEHISRVTLWGLSDGDSWRSENNPLLFDRNLQAKLAYHALVDPEKFIEENAPDEVVARDGEARYGSPTLGEDIDEIWDEASTLPIDRFQDAHNVATGEAKVLWDDENLYVKVDVNDTELDKSSSEAHEQDSVEVFIDEQNTKAASYGEGHGQYRVNFDNEQSFDPTDIEEGFESVTVVDGTNYTVQMKIPFKTTDVENGHTIGFDVQINDASNGSRDGVAIWNDQSGMGWSDPSVFGNIELVKDEEQQPDPDPKPDPEPEPEPDPDPEPEPKPDPDPEEPEEIEKVESLDVTPVITNSKATIRDSDTQRVDQHGQLIIDLTEHTSVEHISLTEEQVNVLIEQNLTLIVKKKDIEIHIPMSIFTANNGHVEIELVQKEDIKEALSSVYDIKLFQGEKEIEQFSKPVTLMFNVNEEKIEKTDDVHIAYLDEDQDTWIAVDGTYAEGQVTADVDHFSIFTVFDQKQDGSIESQPPHAEKGDKLPKTATQSFNWLLLGLLLTGLGSIALIIYKKRRV